MLKYQRSDQQEQLPLVFRASVSLQIPKKFRGSFTESMASKVSSLQKVVQASNFLVKNGNIYYKQLVEQNKHHIQEPPTIEKCQTLAKQLFYTRLASIPGRYEAFWKEADSLKNALINRQELNVENAGLAALFGLECYAWFCGGEIIGRGFTFTGYYV